MKLSVKDISLPFKLIVLPNSSNNFTSNFFILTGP